MAAHHAELGPRPQEFVTLSELTDYLIRRVLPSFVVSAFSIEDNELSNQPAHLTQPTSRDDFRRAGNSKEYALYVHQ